MINKKYAFTLTEVMIVFTLIGILSALLLPSLFIASPDKGKIKAVKAYNTLVRSIESLSNGVYDVNDSSNTLVSVNLVSGADNTKKNNADRYFCNQLTQILNIKNSDCTIDAVNTAMSVTASDCNGSFSLGSVTTRKALCIKKTTDSTRADYADLQTKIDTNCTAYFNPSSGTAQYNFKTTDGVMWGIQLTNFSNSSTIEVDSVKSPSHYNLVCMCTSSDISDCSDYTFGAGVRKDGKIVIGAKLQAALDENLSDNN